MPTIPRFNSLRKVTPDTIPRFNSSRKVTSDTIPRFNSLRKVTPDTSVTCHYHHCPMKKMGLKTSEHDKAHRTLNSALPL